MKLIAFYIIDQPQNLAINTLAVIATDIGVYPSTLVRFAKHFGLVVLLKYKPYSK